MAFSATLLVGIEQVVAQAQEPPEVHGLATYIERGLQDWGVPGLAIAVVKNDEVVYARGFGVRRLGSPETIDEHTLFDIASTTKAITAAMIGMLVDEGKVHWDDPVVKHIPHFQLSDPWVTNKVTIRDLLAHRTGLGRTVGGRLHFMTNHDREEVLYRARYIPFDRRFGSYSYNNIMYLAAGQIIQYVDGQSWDDFVTRRLFGPLNMTRSYTTRAGPQFETNRAVPHAWVDGKVQQVRYRSFDNIGPAGSITSSVSQMAQWLRLQLGRGVYEGRRLISESVVIEQHSAQIVLPASEPFGPLQAYGFGYNLTDYRGYRLSRHGGGADGMNAQVLLVPQERLGVVLLSNHWEHDLTTAIANRVVDSYLGIPERDWSAELLRPWQEKRARAEELRQQRANSRKRGTRTSLPTDRYAGVYRDDLYADIVVRHKDGKLQIEFWNVDYLIADLEHWHYDTFRAVWRDRFQGDKLVWFELDKNGDVDTLNVEWALRPAPDNYKRIARFKRVGDVGSLVKAERTACRWKIEKISSTRCE